MTKRRPQSLRSDTGDRLAAVVDERLPLLVIEPGQQPPERDPYGLYLGQLRGETLRTMRGCLDRLARILAGVRLDEPSAEDLERGVPLVTGAWIPWWEQMVADVAAYVPGYQMVQEVQITEIPADQPVQTLLPDGEDSVGRPTHQVSVFLKVEGAGMYLPTYAGNLDIMTSAAVQVAEKIAAKEFVQ